MPRRLIGRATVAQPVKLLKLRRRHRSGEKVTLNKIAAEALQKTQLMLILHPFRHHAQPDAEAGVVRVVRATRCA